MNQVNELEGRIQKLSKVLNIILIISIIWYVVMTVLQGVAMFVPIDSYFTPMAIMTPSGFISSALTLFVLVQLRIIVMQSEQLIPFDERSQKALATMAYLELIKFFYLLLMPVIVGEGLNFNFSYLIFSGVLFVLVNVFKFASHQSETFMIQTKLLKWMNIGLILDQIFWSCALVFLGFGFILMRGIFQLADFSNDPILSEALFMLGEQIPGTRGDLMGEDFVSILPFFIMMILLIAFIMVYTINQVRKIIKVLRNGNPFDDFICKSLKKVSISFIACGFFEVLFSFLMFNNLVINPFLALIYSVSFSSIVAGILVLLLHYLFQYAQNEQRLTH